MLLVVSEETGRISLATAGKLEAVPRENLSVRLASLLTPWRAGRPANGRGGSSRGAATGARPDANFSHRGGQSADDRPTADPGADGGQPGAADLAVRPQPRTGNARQRADPRRGRPRRPTGRTISRWRCPADDRRSRLVRRAAAASARAANDDPAQGDCTSSRRSPSPTTGSTRADSSDSVVIDASDINAPLGVTAHVSEGRNAIPYTLHRLVEKRLPVRFDYVREGPTGPVVLEPATVLVRGPKEVLDGAKEIRTQPSELPSRPLHAPANVAAIGRVTMVARGGRPAVRVTPSTVQVRVPGQARKSYDLNDIQVQFLCPPNFHFKPQFLDERSGKLSLKLRRPGPGRAAARACVHRSEQGEIPLGAEPRAASATITYGVPAGAGSAAGGGVRAAARRLQPRTG